MLKYIANLSNNYLLVDDEFTYSNEFMHKIEIIVQAYHSRNLPIVPNLKLFFTQIAKKDRLVDAKSYYSRRSFIFERNWEIYENYYPCILNHIQKLEFVKK